MTSWKPPCQVPCAQVMPEVKYLSSSKAEVLKDLDLRQLQSFAEARCWPCGSSKGRG